MLNIKHLQSVEQFQIKKQSQKSSYRRLSNQILLQLWQAQAITVEQLLENGDFPFADDLLQSIKSQKEQIANGETPQPLPPELMQQVSAGANSDAVNMLKSHINAA